MNSLLAHWVLFTATNEIIQNLVKSLDVQGHLFVVADLEVLFNLLDLKVRELSSQLHSS
jgi:hypothetical protein